MRWDSTGCYGIFKGGLFWEFNSFGTRPYDVVSSNMPRGEFCKIITDLSVAESDPLDLHFDTYRKYLHVANSIAKLAKSINAYIEASKEPTISNKDSGLNLLDLQNNCEELPDRNFNNLLVDISNSKIYYDSKTEMLFIGKSRLQIPKSILPDKPEDHELAYVNELLVAYSSVNSEKLSIDTLKGKFKRDYLDQRINYFSDLDVERFARETINVDDEQVSLWKSDFSYINSVLWGNFDDGFQRLLVVMAKACGCKNNFSN